MFKETRVLGLMSGTSLDGVDAAICSFEATNAGWKYSLIHAETIPYSDYWKKTLSNAFGMNGRELTKLDADYGKFLGKLSRGVIESFGSDLDLISSHGHTVFHDPANGYTLQIGNGANIAHESSLPVVCNFRVRDIAEGGQGAPLVPAGDFHLFNKYQACLNLGGFANISFDHNSQRIAFDICPVNIALNYLSQQSGSEFDIDGKIGKRGKIIEPLLRKLDHLSYYNKIAPKSLGREWVEEVFLPLLNVDKHATEDQLHTVYHHIVNQIAGVFEKYGIKVVLITGGGVHNKFLLDLLRLHSAIEIIIPDHELIDYKEAIIFAFLGVLRMENKTNCFSSVTGAKRDTSCGTIFLP